MTAEKILVAFATRAGSTAEVAQEIGKQLIEAGYVVDVLAAPKVKDLTPYRAVILGSAVRIARVLPEAVKFMKQHSKALKTLPTAYFLVNLTMKEDTPEHRAAAQGFAAPLCALKEPVSLGLFGGVFDPERLTGLWRIFMSKSDLPRGDFRDWAAIHSWTDELIPKLPAP